jgi:hypothetical protein
MQLFIGLTFNQSQLQFKKIDSFRKRFDDKYQCSHLLQMTLLPPFKLVVNDLSDDLDGQFCGIDKALEVDFNGFDFVTTGRNGVVFLKPTLPVDLYHCQEAIQGVLKELGATSKKHKNLARCSLNDLQTFLPIGRFDDMDLMSVAVNTAKIEFDGPFSLRANNLVLFEKTPTQWLPLRILHSFEQGISKDGQVDFSLAPTPVTL